MVINETKAALQIVQAGQHPNLAAHAQVGDGEGIAIDRFLIGTDTPTHRRDAAGMIKTIAEMSCLTDHSRKCS